VADLRETSIEDLIGQLDPIDRASLDYRQLSERPDVRALPEARRQQLFQEFGGGGLPGPEGRAARKTVEAQAAETPPGPMGRSLAQLSQFATAGPEAFYEAEPTGAQTLAASAAPWWIKTPLQAALPTAGEAAGFALGGPPGAAVGAGAGEALSQAAGISPWSPTQIGLATAAAPIAAGAGKVVGAVPQLWARRPSAVATAREAVEQTVQAGEAAGRQAMRALPGQVPGQVEPDVLSKMYQEARRQIPGAPPIPTTATQQAIRESPIRFARESQARAVTKLYDAVDRVSGVLQRRDPQGRMLPPSEIKASLMDLDTRLHDIREVMLELKEDSPARGLLSRLASAVSKDLRAEADRAGGSMAAKLLRDANQAWRAQSAADRVQTLVNQVIPDAGAPFGAKQAEALIKKLRTDQQLADWLDDPNDLEQLIGQARAIGERMPAREALEAGLAEPLKKPGLIGGGLMAGGPVAALLTGEPLTALGTVAAGLAYQYGPEVVKEAGRAAANPRARLITSGILHGARRAATQAREAELRKMRPGFEQVTP
jgi:hypothetical protein